MDGLNKVFGTLLVVAVILGALVILTPFILKTPIQENVTTNTTTIELKEPAREEQVEAPSVYNELISRIMSYAKLITTIYGTWRGISMPETGIIPISLPVDTGSVIGRKTPQYSKTNVQVYGIDEQDIVKTDGRAIYTCRGTDIAVFDVYNSNVASKIRISSGLKCSGLYVGNHLLVAILLEQYFVEIPRTIVYIINVEDPYNPVIAANFTIDGSLQGSRLNWPYLYIVTQLQAFNTIYTENNEVYTRVFIPRINGVYIEPAYIKMSKFPPQNHIVVFSLDLEELSWNSTSILMNNVERIYMSHNRLYIVGSVDPIFLAIKEILDGALSLEILPSNVSQSIQSYVSKGNHADAYNVLLKYLTSLDYEEAIKVIERINSLIIGVNDKTLIATLSINKLSLEFKGFIEIEGRILDQFAIEEFEISKEDYLVLATTTTEYRVLLNYYEVIVVTPEESIYVDYCGAINDRPVCVRLFINVSGPSPTSEEKARESSILFIYPWILPQSWKNTIYVVQPDLLKIISVLGDLAPGERVYAARLIKNIFYLVTFRTVDPLYAIDLGDPENPVILGYLKIPGFSEYLHPVGDHLLIGIGREDSHLKISLFDISDPKNITERTFIKIPRRSIIVDNDDYHAFLFDERYDACYIPVSPEYRGSSGILVVFIDRENAIIKQNIKFLEHNGAIRTIYIEDMLYTISYNSIRIWSLPELELINEVPLE